MPTLVDTTFSNHIINTENLPKIQSLPFEKLSPDYLKIRRWLYFSTSLLLLIIGFILYYQPFYTFEYLEATIILVGSFALFLLNLLMGIYIVLADKHKFFALREQDISYASGLLFKTIVTQPILRIQHVELKQGPIERKMQLAKLQLFSAGGALYTFEIPGLTLKQAESIRQFILEHNSLIIKQ